MIDGALPNGLKLITAYSVDLVSILRDVSWENLKIDVREKGILSLEVICHRREQPKFKSQIPYSVLDGRLRTPTPGFGVVLIHHSLQQEKM
jgi:hypothetical protein